MNIECIEHLEFLFNNSECKSFVCTGNININFDRGNSHCKYLAAFIERNHLLNSMNCYLCCILYLVVVAYNAYCSIIILYANHRCIALPYPIIINFYGLFERKPVKHECSPRCSVSIFANGNPT